MKKKNLSKQYLIKKEIVDLIEEKRKKKTTKQII